MAKDNCRFHPHISAVACCSQCGIPLCKDCTTQRPEGIFCSGGCYEKYTSFVERSGAGQSRKGASDFGKLFKKIIFVVVLLVAFFIFMYWSYGVDSPAKLPGGLKEMLFDFLHLFSR